MYMYMYIYIYIHIESFIPPDYKAIFLKIVSTTLFTLVCFANLKETKRELVKLGKMCFISLQKLFPLLRKSNFSILVIQIS